NARPRYQAAGPVADAGRGRLPDAVASRIVADPAPRPAPPSAASAPESARERTPPLELLIVTLLGIVSIASAWSSFQSSLYGGIQSASYAQAQTLQTEAESLYLEANQQYIRDGQTLARLNELSLLTESPDPA